MNQRVSAFSKFVIITSLLIFISGCDLFQDKSLKQINSFITEQAIDKTQENWKTSLPKPPQVEFTEGKRYLWKLNTNQGDITIQLFPQIAPMHVSSTIYLTQLGFYDDLIFHRVINGFMAQGGDPLGTGRGNPGYRYDGEFSDDVTHSKGGLLSMANAGPGTDGSQFFLTFAATPWLDGKHTIFGEIIEGQDVMEKIEALGSRSGRTKEDITLIKANILIQ